MNISVEVAGLNELKEAANEVVKKAKELEQAVQQLNEVEIELKTEFANN